MEIQIQWAKKTRPKSSCRYTASRRSHQFCAGGARCHSILRRAAAVRVLGNGVAWCCLISRTASTLGPERRLEINLPSRSSGSSSRSVQSPALATESGEVWYVYVPMRRGELSTSFIATARGFRQAAGAFLPHGPLVARPDASASQNVCRQGALYLHSCLFSVCQLPAGLPVSFSKHARVPAVVKWSALETCSECSTQYNSSSSKARPPKIRASMKACWCFLVRPKLCSARTVVRRT